MENYCLLTGGRCSHHPIDVEVNTFFVSEPYDKNRAQREKSIIDAIRGYRHIIADHKAMTIAISCKICQQIQSSQFGIVDITSGNRNVLIELGMLYGFNKPVIILVKNSAKTKIKIPSNIIGIEQVRYDNYNDLTLKLRNVLPPLFEIWKNHSEYLMDLGPILEFQIEQFKLTIETRRLLFSNFEAKISGLTYVDNMAIIVINKGTEHGVKKNMIFRIIGFEKKIDEDYLEEDVGFLIVKHSQDRISQCLLLSVDQTKQFWKDFFERVFLLPRHIVKPYQKEEFERMTDDELLEFVSKLEILLEGYKVTKLH